MNARHPEMFPATIMAYSRNIPPMQEGIKMSTHIRAHIRLANRAEAMTFIRGLSKFNDNFTIENSIGVTYTMFDFPEEMYLVNGTRDGFIPSFADDYRMSGKKSPSCVLQGGRNVYRETSKRM